MSRPVSVTAWTTALLLAIVMVAFWYFALVAPAQEQKISIRSVDLYQEHYPVAKYGGEMLRGGEIPVWNPYQLNGLPFLAVPHSRIFYPPNLIYLWSETGIAIEIDLIAHWLFAGVGLWLLIRAWGMGHLAGFAAATSFMLSRWLIGAIQWPGIVACAAWLPWTLFLVDGVFRKRRWAPIGLALALALQIFNGATEFVVYNGYACALYTAVRSIPYWREKGTRDLLVRVGLLGCAVVGGVGLAAIQILPTLELLSLSGRFGGGTSLAYARGGPFTGYIPPGSFSRRAWSLSGWAALGVLPVVGMLSIPRRPANRLPWLFAVALATYATLLIFGGDFFELYFQTPMGQVFRRPSKFFYQYNLALGIFAAYATTRLLAVRSDGRLFDPRHRPVWVASMVCAGWGLWLVYSSISKPMVLLAIALLISFVLVSNARYRFAVCIALCTVQVINLTLTPRNHSMRPFQQEHLFDGRVEVLDQLRDQAGNQRIYTSPKFLFNPATTAKQGLLRRAYFAIDYEPLVTGRQRDYYLQAAMERSTTSHFSGSYFLGENTRWGLLDYAAVRFYLVRPADDAFDFLRKLAELPRKTGVRMHRERGMDVLERTQAFPRAYFVPNAIAIPDAEAILDRMGQRNFRARETVYLELESNTPTRRGHASGRSSVEIETPDPETVVLEVESDQQGYVVLTDTWYPGWRATVNGRDVAIHRANYLFRAVEVAKGRSTIVYRYAPESLRKGAQISGIFALALVVVTVFAVRAKRD